MATPLGIFTPPDSTKISQLAASMRELARTADLAINTASTPFFRGVIPENADLNDFSGIASHAGFWTTGASVLASYKNMPKTLAGVNMSGNVLILAAGGGVRQIGYEAGTNQMYARNSINLAAKTYTAWEALNDKRGEIPANTNLNDWITPEFNGTWRISSQARADTITGLPAGFATVGFVHVDAQYTGATYVANHTYGTYGAYISALHWRSSISGTDRTWNAWSRLDQQNAAPASPSGAGEAALSNQLLKERATKARMGTLGIGKKAGVALRFDDCINALKAWIVPLLRTHGMPFTAAHCSQSFIDPEMLKRSNQGTWGDVQGWALNDGG